MRRSTFASIVMVALLLTACAVAMQRADRFKLTEEYLDILVEDRPVLRYMYAYDPQRRDETYKPYHHVLAPDGESLLTKGPGGRFPHHRGIYIGWNRIRHGGEQHDLWHMHQNAAQVHQRFLANDTSPEQTRSSSLIHWIGRDGETVILEETRTIILHHTDSDAHALIDVISELKAVNGDVYLGGDAEHAGLQYRPHNDVVDNKSAKYVFSTEGLNLTQNNTRQHRDMPWATLTYELKGGTWTVQYMNHPDNPEGSYYSAYRDYGRFGAFFTKEIKDGETLTLRYRLRITEGDAPGHEAMNNHYRAYVR